MIPYGKQKIDKADISLVLKSLKKKKISGGDYVYKLEKFSNNYFNINHSISCNSGTSGLHAALYAAKVGKGDEVVMPALTVVMDAYAILHLGAKPIFVDVDLKTHLIDTEDLVKKITNKTKTEIESIRSR